MNPPPLTAIVPLLLAAPLTTFKVRARPNVTSPWLASSAVSVRPPLAPATAVIVPVAALVRGPPVTVRVAP